ncbi:MAG: hypothetical protein H0X55_03600 [Thermoleophilaceae bacterium]|nr:hypothetical protein [Thermoleophilaceae bacterium]
MRLASKSVRCRSLQAAVLERAAGFRGTRCFTLPEALWLSGHGFDDLLVAYPSADRAALDDLGRPGRSRGSPSWSTRASTSA